MKLADCQKRYESKDPKKECEDFLQRLQILRAMDAPICQLLQHIPEERLIPDGIVDRWREYAPFIMTTYNFCLGLCVAGLPRFARVIDIGTDAETFLLPLLGLEWWAYNPEPSSAGVIHDNQDLARRLADQLGIDPAHAARNEFFNRSLNVQDIRELLEMPGSSLFFIRNTIHPGEGVDQASNFRSWSEILGSLAGYSNAYTFIMDMFRGKHVPKRMSKDKDGGSLLTVTQWRQLLKGFSRLEWAVLPKFRMKANKDVISMIQGRLTEKDYAQRRKRGKIPDWNTLLILASNGTKEPSGG